MVYDDDPRNCGDGQWHCPFTPQWVERIKHAVNRCDTLTVKSVEATLYREKYHYEIPKKDFLSESQDSRGLPLSWCEQEKRKYKNWPDCCTAIYDFSSIPDIVVTNGEDDWPLTSRMRVLTA